MSIDGISVKAFVLGQLKKQQRNMLLMLLELAPQGVRLSAHVKFMEQNVFCQRYVALIYLEILKKLVSCALFFLDVGGKGCGVQI